MKMMKLWNIFGVSDFAPTLNVVEYEFIGTLSEPSGTSVDYIEPSGTPVDWDSSLLQRGSFCSWCGGITHNDKYGHCAACGGPREIR